MSDHEQAPDSVADILDFHCEFAAAWIRFSRAIRQRLQLRNVDSRAIDAITRRLHQHAMGSSGMTTASAALEEVIAALLFWLLELEASRHSER